MRQLPTLLCLFTLGLGLVACGGTTARQRQIMQSDPETLSDDDLAEREAMLRRMEEDRRSGRSRIPGLTVGQVEDMPGLPALPEFITEDSTLEQLRLHARITAQAELIWALPGSISIDDRITYLMYYWQPQFELVQARLAKMREGRGTLNTRYQKRISQQTRWREEREALDKHWRRTLAKDRMQVNTIVE